MHANNTILTDQSSKYTITSNPNSTSITVIKIKKLGVLIKLPSLRGVKHSYEISNWNGLRKAAGLSKTVTFVMLTALIVKNRNEMIPPKG